MQGDLLQVDFQNMPYSLYKVRECDSGEGQRHGAPSGTWREDVAGLWMLNFRRAKTQGGHSGQDVWSRCDSGFGIS